MARIDANSGTNINVALTYYEYLDRPSIDRYGKRRHHSSACVITDSAVDMAIFSRPNLDLVCDVNVQGSYACHLEVDVEIPLLLQTVIREVKSLTWSVSHLELIV